MATDTYDIQELINQSGVPRRTIYFYVQQGILPPPEGAGLAAHYTEDHLLRLRLIPLLRQQGLRLDEIRARFSQMSKEEMSRLLNGSPPAAPRSIREPLPGAPLPGKSPVPPFPGVPFGWGEQRYTHYTLPAGMTLVAPENLSALERQRLNQLLQAARQIFSGSSYIIMEAGQNNPSNDAGGRKPPEEK
jgi:DNA-binding transcriptional MerR regulator